MTSPPSSGRIGAAHAAFDDTATGTLNATSAGKTAKVTEFSCSLARSGGVSYLFSGDKVVFGTSVGPAGQDPGEAGAYLLEWKGDKATVAKEWQGADIDDPPAWAALPK